MDRVGLIVVLGATEQFAPQ